MRIMMLCGLLALLGCSNGVSAQHKKINRSTVGELDLERYMGKWYEIARFDHHFERNMVRVTTFYTLMPKGVVKVENYGYVGSKDGKSSYIMGRAKIPNSAEPGRIKVKFFWFISSDYLVLELDKQNYSYALVGSSSADYLWILSRTPTLPREELNRMIEAARSRGYDTKKFIFVDQR